MKRPTSQKIVLCSVLKSGTWLLRKIIRDLTGKEFFEPNLFKSMNPEDPSLITVSRDRFYSWHFTPTNEICEKLKEEDARTIFLVRNIYDVVVSIYFHFLNNIDEEIGRGANKSEYFSNISFQEGLSQIIHGSENEHFSWSGISFQLNQIQRIFKHSLEDRGLIVSYEHIVSDKISTIRKIKDFVGSDKSEFDLQRIATSSEFNAMKEEAKKLGIKSHFREGSIGSGRKYLSDQNRTSIRAILETEFPHLRSIAEEMGFEHVLD